MNIDTKPRNRIKKIFLDGIMHLGDVITAASVIPVLKEQYPHSEIHYLVKDSVALPASLICGVDRVIPYTYQSGGGALDVIRMGKKLSQEGYDLEISLDPRERVTLMKWIARIPLRLSMERALGWELGWEKWFYTQDLSYRASWDYKNHRMGESYQRLMRDYFGDESQEFIPPALVPSASKDLAAADALLAGCSAKGPKVLFCVETTAKAKDWRAEKFAALADWLITSYDASVIITGIEAHRPKMDAIKNRMKHPESIIDTLGKTTFPALVALMRRADCAITLDTGTTHIAAAAGCPVLTIFTFNSPEIYQGCGERTWAVSGHVPCSGKHVCIGPKKCPKNLCEESVTLSMVQETVKEMLESL